MGGIEAAWVGWHSVRHRLGTGVPAGHFANRDLCPRLDCLPRAVQHAALCATPRSRHGGHDGSAGAGADCGYLPKCYGGQL